MSHLRIYLAAFAYLLLASSLMSQDPTTYTFNGTVNNVWSTTGNWTPSYPGTSTTEGDIIVIDAQCRASGMSIEIGGGIIINPEKELNISATTLSIIGTMTIYGDLSIQSSGMLLNSGYTTLESTGKIINIESVVNESVMILEGSVENTGQWMNTPFGEMQLLSMASFDNSNNFINNGMLEDFSSGFVNNLNFDNNGELNISGAFVNAANLTNTSNIFVDGNFSTTEGSNLFNHKLLDICSGATVNNSGTTYIFSSADLSNSGTIINSDKGRIFNQGTISTKGGVYFSMKPGSYLENQPGSAITVN